MTEKQEYEAILSALADKLIENKETIKLQQIKIELLERKLADAEKHIVKEI